MVEKYDELYNSIVLDADGARIGGVSQVYLDDATGLPTFITAKAGIFGQKEVLISFVGAFASDGFIQVPHDTDLIKQAPGPSPDRHLSPTQEAEVLRHYGLPFVLPDADQTPQLT